MGLNRLDFAIIAAYLIGITLFGLRFRKRQRTLRDYFLAGRDIPWWAISLSIVAAETSTLTIISIPGLAYDTNLTFLQVVLGYVAGRVVISFVLLPHYFRGDLYTAYELIERRFGRKLRSLTAGLFLLTRAAAEAREDASTSITALDPKTLGRLRVGREGDRLSEDDIARHKMGARGLPGEPPPAPDLKESETQIPKPLDPGHTA